MFNRLMTNKAIAIAFIGAGLTFCSHASAAVLTYEWVTVTSPSIASVNNGLSTTSFELIGAATGTLQIDTTLSAGTYSFDSTLPPFTSLTNFSTPRSAVSAIYSLSFSARYSIYRTDFNGVSTPLRSFAGQLVASSLLIPLNSLPSTDFSFANYFYNGGSGSRIARGALLLADDNTLSLTGLFGERSAAGAVFTQFESFDGFTNITDGGGAGLNDSAPTGLTGYWRLAGTNAFPGGAVNRLSTPSSIALLLISLAFLRLNSKKRHVS
jgi:hypothetical protein